MCPYLAWVALSTRETRFQSQAQQPASLPRPAANARPEPDHATANECRCHARYASQRAAADHTSIDKRHPRACNRRIEIVMAKEGRRGMFGFCDDSSISKAGVYKGARVPFSHREQQVHAARRRGKTTRQDNAAIRYCMMQVRCPQVNVESPSS